jgi:segregation and condensation protein B
LTRTETFALTAIAYLQPVTRGEISKLAGREISRDVIAALKRHGLIDGAIRAPQPGAPFAYVTTRTFLEALGFGSLRDLPDLEQLKAEGLLQTGEGQDDLDGALGMAGAEGEVDTSENAEEWDLTLTAPLNNLAKVGEGANLRECTNSHEFTISGTTLPGPAGKNSMS